MKLLWPNPAEKSEEMFNSILTSLSETSGVFFFLWDIRSDAYFMSPAARVKYGLEASGPLGPAVIWEAIVYAPDKPIVKQLYLELMRGKKKDFELDYRMVTPKGERSWVTTRCHALCDEAGSVAFLVGSVMEIENANRADQLTGLLNKTQFGVDFEKNLQYAHSCYFVIFGIDDFKAVNDRHGHAFGNKLLRLFARELEEKMAAGSRVYRMTGDCFAVNLVDKNDRAVIRFYNTVKDSFQEAARTLRAGLFCTVSAGAALFPGDSRDFEQLGQFAESALNTAKRAGKNNLVFFSRDSYDEYLQDISLREDLQRCVRNNLEGFEVYYQPQIAVDSGRILGAEALLRWNSAEHGRIGPDTFIPLLERMGLICEVGRWVLEQAIDQCGRWRKRIPTFCMSVNISYMQMEKDDVAERVLTCLRRNTLPGEAVLLELTESAQLNNYRYYNETLSYLNRLGVMVAIDDFGTGYSSLGYFKELHVNQIKIDRSFVSRIRESEYDFKLIKFIIEMAHGEGVSICVEGVETVEEVKALLPLRPDIFQGFYFGRPAAPAEFERLFIEEWQDPVGLMQSVPAYLPLEEMHGDGGPFCVDEQAEFERLLDEINEIVFISDLDTHEMLYLNRAGRTLLNAGEYTGAPCYQVLQHRTQPCDNCSAGALSRDTYSSREYTRPFTGGKVTVKDKLVPWNGRMARMGVTCDLNAGMQSRERVAHQLEIDMALRTCLQELSGQKDLQACMNALLKIAGDFHKADRAYLFTLSGDGQVAKNLFEWCRDDVTPEMQALQEIEIHRQLPRWLEAFLQNRPVVISSALQFETEYPLEYTTLKPYGIRTMLLVPLFALGRLLGFMGLDTPRFAQEDTSFLCALANMVANALGQEQLAERLHYQTHYDALTGVYNNSRYFSDIETQWEPAPASMGVVFADVDGLKEINEERGYKGGDEVLKTFAKDLACCFDGFKLYRLWGDKFVALCANVGQEELQERLKRLEAISSRGGYSLSVGSVWENQSMDMMRLTAEADSALDEKKKIYSQQQLRREKNKPKIHKQLDTFEGSV